MSNPIAVSEQALGANPYNLPQLKPGCPWADWDRPNIKWCEENLCEWITAPADTWSNLGFIILGIVMWRLAVKSGQRSMRIFGPASIVVGLTSFIYHASYTFAFQFADFVGMFVFVDLLISFNQRRSGSLSAANHLKVYLAEVTVSSLLVVVFFYAGIPIQSLVAVTILWAIGQEIALVRGGKRAGNYRLFALGLGFSVAGATCSALDVSGIWCDPHNHFIQGHAMWHVLMSVALLCMYHFYAQFDFDNDATAV